jgi:hypothetical protein
VEENSYCLRISISAGEEQSKLEVKIQFRKNKSKEGLIEQTKKPKSKPSEEQNSSPYSFPIFPEPDDLTQSALHLSNFDGFSHFMHPNAKLVPHVVPPFLMPSFAMSPPTTSPGDTPSMSPITTPSMPPVATLPTVTPPVVSTSIAMSSEVASLMRQLMKEYNEVGLDLDYFGILKDKSGTTVNAAINFRLKLENCPNDPSNKELQEHRIKLKSFWDRVVTYYEEDPLFFSYRVGGSNSYWLTYGRNYTELVEPFEIANYYGKKLHVDKHKKEGEKEYFESDNRPYRYTLICQIWREVKGGEIWEDLQQLVVQIRDTR